MSSILSIKNVDEYYHLWLGCRNFCCREPQQYGLFLTSWRLPVCHIGSRCYETILQQKVLKNDYHEKKTTKRTDNWFAAFHDSATFLMLALRVVELCVLSIQNHVIQTNWQFYYVSSNYVRDSLFCCKLNN